MSERAAIDPPEVAPEIFDLTMRGLETGLRVRDIATFGFHACDVADDARGVMLQPELLRFDCIPVIERGRVVGILERNGTTLSTGSAQENMRLLDDGLLVSADEPLKAFIPVLVETPHRLVVRGSRIEGIVTSSDIHKLPVRLLAFALITHLEMTMASVIVRGSEGDEWMDLLSPGRQDKVREKFASLRTGNFDPPLIEVTDFCDKRTVLVKRGVVSLPDKAQAIADFESIEQLRNSLAHAGTYAQNHELLASFVRLLALTEAWIRRLSTLQDTAE